MFSFVSVKNVWNPRKYEGETFHSYKAEGQKFHYCAAALADNDEKPRGLQIYLFDSNQQWKYRSELFRDKKDEDSKTRNRKRCFKNKIIHKINDEINIYTEWYEQNRYDDAQNVLVEVDENPTIPTGVSASQHFTHSSVDQIPGFVQRDHTELLPIHKEMGMVLKGGDIQNLDERDAEILRLEDVIITRNQEIRRLRLQNHRL